MDQKKLVSLRLISAIIKDDPRRNEKEREQPKDIEGKAGALCVKSRTAK